MAVGIKPTIGLTSQAGVMPISPRQDTVYIGVMPVLTWNLLNIYNICCFFKAHTLISNTNFVCIFQPKTKEFGQNNFNSILFKLAIKKKEKKIEHKTKWAAYKKN